jgi:hypothetical protein
MAGALFSVVVLGLRQRKADGMLGKSITEQRSMG